MLDQGTCLNYLATIKDSCDATKLPSLLLELFLSTQMGNEDRLIVLNQVFSLSTEPEWLEHVQELLVDIIWLLDLEYSEVASSSQSASLNEIGNAVNTEKSLLISLVSLIIQTGILPFPLLLERLEPEFLQSLGIVASADLFNKKVIKINTSLFYRQQKFNLLREESEGFCRLIILLASNLNFSNNNLTSIDLLYDRILETIGFFDLDPLKVLDILLESFAFGLNSWKDHLNLLSKFAFPPTSIIGILGFKLKNVYNDVKFSSEYLEQVLTVVALLISNDFITLESIWPHFKPSEDDCLQEFIDFKAKIKENSSKMGVVNLCSSSSAQTATTSNSSLAPESLTEQFAQDTLNTKLIPSLSSSRNLKSHLILALLSIGSVDLAFKILSNYPHLAVLNHKISSKICSVIEVLLNENGENNSLFLMGTLKLSEESGNVSNWLNLLPSGGLFHSPKVFSKLCKLIKPSGSASILLQKHLIPALAASSHDSLILSQELWNCYISSLPYAQRYSIYGAWMDNFYDSELFGPMIKANSISEARKVMRRLAKENVRQYGRLVAKVTHSNPVIVLPLILDQLQSYDNIIPAVIDAFRFLTPLSFDILLFCLLRALSSTEKDRLKADGTNIASWLQNLANFSSAIFRKYPQILDPAPLLRYIYSQLLDDNCLDVLILQELLIQMAGIERPENASEAVLEASSAGGPELLNVIKAANLQSLGLSGPSKRALNRLKSSLESENLTVPLLIALAQASDAAIYRMDYSHLKLVSTLTDTCNSAFLQYLEYLKLIEAPLENVSFESLVKQNKLEIPVALLISKTFSLSIEGLGNIYKETFVGIDYVPEEFLKTFWFLKLSDISVPMSRYQQEMTRLLSSNKSKVEALQQEMKENVVQCGKVRDLLVKSKDSWFTSNDRSEIVNSILKLALLPRMLLGPMEALHSAKFLFLLHSLGPSRFSTLSLLDSIFDTLPGLLLSSLTEAESHCFGRFMHEIMIVMQSWQGSQEKYEREAIACHLPGLMKRWSHFLDVSDDCEDEDDLKNTLNTLDTLPALDSIDINSPEEGEVSDDISVVEVPVESKSTEMDVDSVTEIVKTSTINENALTWQDFRHVLFKWHDKLFNTVFNLLTSNEYSSIRNSIIFLSHLSGGTFPRLLDASEKLEAAVLEIKSKESREDLKVLATRYSAMLIQNKPKLLKEREFHQCAEEIVVEIPIETSANSSPGKKRSSNEPSSSVEKRLKSDGTRDSSGSRDSRDTRESRDIRDTRESKDTRDARESRDSRLDRRETSSRSTTPRVVHDKDVRKVEPSRDSRDRTPLRSDRPEPSRSDRDRDRDREREKEKEKDKQRDRVPPPRSSSSTTDRDSSRSSRRYEDTDRSRRH